MRGSTLIAIQSATFSTFFQRRVVSPFVSDHPPFSPRADSLENHPRRYLSLPFLLYSKQERLSTVFFNFQQKTAFSR